MLTSTAKAFEMLSLSIPKLRLSAEVPDVLIPEIIKFLSFDVAVPRKTFPDPEAPPYVEGVVIRTSLGPADVLEKSTGAALDQPLYVFTDTVPEGVPIVSFNKVTGIPKVLTVTVVAADEAEGHPLAST